LVGHNQTYFGSVGLRQAVQLTREPEKRRRFFFLLQKRDETLQKMIDAETYVLLYSGSDSTKGGLYLRFRDFHPNIKLRIVLSFVTGTVSNMIYPFMAIYFSDKLSPAIASLNVTVSLIFGMVFSLIGGYYADRIGRRKLLITAEALAFVSYFLLAAFNSPWLESAWVTFAVTILNSIFWGLMGPASDAMMLDVTEPESRKYVYRIQYWGNNLSIALTGMIGALLFKSFLFEMLAVMTGLSLIALIVTALFIHETYTPAPDAKLGTGLFDNLAILGRSYWDVLKDKMFVVYTLASILITSVEFHLGNYVGVRLEQEMHSVPFLGWHLDGIGMLGVLRTENTLIIVLFSLFMGFLMRKFSDKTLLVAGIAMYVLGYSYLAYSNSPWMLILCMLIASIGELVNVPVHQAFFAYIVPDHARSSYMAISGMTFRLSLLIGGIGVAFVGIAPSWLMALAIGGIGFIGFVLLLSVLPSIERRKNGVASVQSGTSASA